MHLRSPQVRGNREHGERTGEHGGWGMRTQRRADGDRRERDRKGMLATLTKPSCCQLFSRGTNLSPRLSCSEFEKSKSKVVSARYLVLISHWIQPPSLQLPWVYMVSSINVNCPIFHFTRLGLARPTSRRNLDQVSRIRNTLEASSRKMNETPTMNNDKSTA